MILNQTLFLHETLFLRALTVHIDRLRTLLGEQWTELQGQLNELLNELLIEHDEHKLHARVHRVLYIFDKTPAETLVQGLFRQVWKHAGQITPSTQTMSITDPTTQETRSVDLHNVVAKDEKGEPEVKVNTQNLTLATRELRQAIGADEKQINAWISELTVAPPLPIRLGKRYTLNLSVGKAIPINLVSDDSRIVSAQDLKGGLQTEWVISASTFELASDDSQVVISRIPRNPAESDLWTAKFSLLIPEQGESEVRQLFIVPQSQQNSRLEVMIYAINGYRTKLYRQFSLEIPVEDMEASYVKPSKPAIRDDLVFTPSAHINVCPPMHEWTTPPGWLSIDVMRGTLFANVIGYLPGRQVKDDDEWGGQQASVKGLIDNVRDTAEKFRCQWEQYLNDIDPDDLQRRLKQFIPIEDWTQWQQRKNAVDLQHTKSWDEASRSPELWKLAVEGHTLYNAFFHLGSKLRNWMDALPPGCRLDISWTKLCGPGHVSNIPWGLMYLPKPPLKAGDPIDPLGFLALRLRIGYYAYPPVPGGYTDLGAMTSTYQVYCLYWGDPLNDPTARNDPTALEAILQRQQFQNWPNQILIPEVLDSSSARDDILQVLSEPQQSPTSVIYLFCQAAVGDGNEPELRFGATSDLKDILERADLESACTDPLKDHPFVFANACKTAAGSPYISNLLAESFLDRGCRGFLGTETMVPIQLASRFATIFFNFFYRKINKAPMAAGEALAQTRLFLLTEYNNIGGIFYTYLNQYELYMADNTEILKFHA